jgi:hypothetical protein
LVFTTVAVIGPAAHFLFWQQATIHCQPPWNDAVAGREEVDRIVSGEEPLRLMGRFIRRSRRQVGWC